MVFFYVSPYNAEATTTARHCEPRSGEAGSNRMSSLRGMSEANDEAIQ
ncbi:MAG: hypothetical protein LBH30_01580 [Prevotellaceae bacterium]|jgi:hypothetical protein|nr:hypothetical protein [Prevotellaceae bacterium]